MSYKKISFKDWHIHMFEPRNPSLTRGKGGYLKRQLRNKNISLEEYEKEYMVWYRQHAPKITPQAPGVVPKEIIMIPTDELSRIDSVTFVSEKQVVVNNPAKVNEEEKDIEEYIMSSTEETKSNTIIPIVGTLAVIGAVAIAYRLIVKSSRQKIVAVDKIITEITPEKAPDKRIMYTSPQPQYEQPPMYDADSFR